MLVRRDRFPAQVHVQNWRVLENCASVWPTAALLRCAWAIHATVHRSRNGISLLQCRPTPTSQPHSRAERSRTVARAGSATRTSGYWTGDDSPDVSGAEGATGALPPRGVRSITAGASPASSA